MVAAIIYMIDCIKKLKCKKKKLLVDMNNENFNRKTDYIIRQQKEDQIKEVKSIQAFQPKSIYFFLLLNIMI